MQQLPKQQPRWSRADDGNLRPQQPFPPYVVSLLVVIVLCKRYDQLYRISVW
jgi:hypothetical protein